jgi:hypothetical protein
MSNQPFRSTTRTLTRRLSPMFILQVHHQSINQSIHPSSSSSSIIIIIIIIIQINQSSIINHQSSSSINHHHHYHHCFVC